ncbi:hypothetical protein BaRGS_00008978 [Batillaria attramentaria]|uniref:Uncharacterized protein n=1 Tax=Batillaria attramentaria TaxID=370345 RepID=A0ABD0LLM4_9CAEN
MAETEKFVANTRGKADIWRFFLLRETEAGKVDHSTGYCKEYKLSTSHVKQNANRLLQKPVGRDHSATLATACSPELAKCGQRDPAKRHRIEGNSSKGTHHNVQGGQSEVSPAQIRVI